MRVFLPEGKQDSSVRKLRIHRLKMNNSGQSLAEFILTFGIVCIVIILFVKLAFNFTKGYMVHYANYMASRSYMVQDNNSASPVSTDDNAKTIAINSVYRKIFGSINQSGIKVLSPGKVENNVYVGIKTVLKEDFSISPMVGGGEKINLVSESFLGRVPVVSECARGTCAAIVELTGESCDIDFITLWDNGC